MQDIADALELSRNTVSKALNNTGILADATRERILQKAQELGYSRFSYKSSADAFTTPVINREIALFTTSIPGNFHFASTMLDYFQNEISNLGYRLSIYLIREKELTTLTLPLGFNRDSTDGILIIEMFDLEYSRMLCKAGIPTLFVDSVVNPKINGLESDFLYMDNTTHVFLIMKELVEQGLTKFGFIGEYMHCQSFYERYQAFRYALETFGLAYHSEFCILDRDYTLTHTDFLKKRFSEMKQHPEVFICANDFIAGYFIHAVSGSGYSVPKDFLLCGFDDSQESKIITPPLTTVHIHSQIMGVSAVQLLISRIKNPDMNYRTVYTETTLKEELPPRTRKINKP